MLTAEEGSDFAAAVKDFFEFRTPFTSPDGAYIGAMDAPGGLGGELVNATLKAGPTAGDLGANIELRLQGLAPDGPVLAETDVDRVERSAGTAGVRVVLRDVNGVFDLATKFNLEALTMVASFALSPIEDKPVASVLPGVELLATFRHPNLFRLGLRIAGAASGSADEILEGESSKLAVSLENLRKVLSLLSNLQAHCSSAIKLPDIQAHAKSQLREWQCVDAILRDEELTLSVPEEHAFDLVAAPGRRRTHLRWRCRCTPRLARSCSSSDRC